MHRDLLNMLINLSNFGADGKQHTRFISQFDAKDILNCIHKQEHEIDRLNNIIDEIERDIKNLYTYGIRNNSEQRNYLLNRLEGLKEYRGDKE